jgi:hypothetical protein
VGLVKAYQPAPRTDVEFARDVDDEVQVLKVRAEARRIVDAEREDAAALDDLYIDRPTSTTYQRPTHSSPGCCPAMRTAFSAAAIRASRASSPLTGPCPWRPASCGT